MDFSDWYDGLKLAYSRISKYVTKTPLIHSDHYSNKDHQVYFKLENLQLTNSFKVRGAFNKLLTLDSDNGVITASTGNHGLATAYALERLNRKGSLVLPKNVDKSKLKKLKEYDIEIIMHGNDGVQAEELAREIARKKGLSYISPYNDKNIICGQGSIGFELFEQLESIDRVFVTVGGGGLISGLALVLKHLKPSIEIVACQPVNSAVMFESVKAGKIMDLKSSPTLSDGSAGGIEANSITFPIVQSLTDKFILVGEDEIRNEILNFAEKEKMLIEGAAAVAIASLKKSHKEKLEGDSIVIICGGNIDPKILF